MCLIQSAGDGTYGTKDTDTAACTDVVMETHPGPTAGTSGCQAAAELAGEVVPPDQHIDATEDQGSNSSLILEDQVSRSSFPFSFVLPQFGYF